ncbi:MAG: hypothetical protein M1832_000831 [Thelocarpon impressellum]|nr:MAG: hypothetical protein M1832_000831 [Thelocarpon impressellum]
MDIRKTADIGDGSNTPTHIPEKGIKDFTIGMDDGPDEPGQENRNLDGGDSDGDDGDDDYRVARAGWRVLFSFTRRKHIASLATALILSVLAGIVIPASTIFLGKVFNAFTDFGGGSSSRRELLHKVSINCAALVVLGGVSWALNGGYFMCWLVFGELQAKSVRDKLFDGLMEKDMEWYDMRRNGVGALIPRLQSQIRELQMATSQPLGFLVQYTVTAVAALGVAFYYSWNLTLVTLATVPVAALLLSFISAQMQFSIEAQEEELSKASKFANSAIGAVETVKCYNGQDHEIWQFAVVIKKAARCYLSQARANALQIGCLRLITLSMFVQGFWYGSTLVEPGGKKPGQVLTTFWAALMATQSIEKILPQMIVLEKGRAAGATLKAIVARVEKGRKIRKMAGNRVQDSCQGDIDMRDVSFSYPSRPEELALCRASFFFPAGETTFVVGKSGSGKSTIGNLIMRYYSNWSGNISIDGNPIQTLDLAWVRENVTLVQQQSVLFNETLWRNVTFGCRDPAHVSKADVRRACRLALLQQTVNDLPDGLETLVGAGGSSMSGGQKQRVAIARARLRDTSILILDESTSALDYISRSLVMDAIRDWRRGKTTIIITHDISQVFEDDYVYVLDEGRVAQEGYRGALEKLPRGPFASRSPVGDPTTSKWDMGTIGEGKAVHLRPKLAIDTRAEFRMSADSLDFQIPQRAQYIPTVFEPSRLEGQRRRTEFTLASPVVMENPKTPMIETPVMQALLLETPPHSPSTDVELMELTGRRAMSSPRNSGRLTPQRSMSTTQTPSSSQPLNPGAVVANAKNLAKETQTRVARISSLTMILSTVWPTLDWRNRIVLVLGFFFALLHAAATPAFSYLFAQLLATFFAPGDREKLAIKWSLSVLGVAVGDGIASYFMHYLLECCGQSWVDSLRIEAFKRVLSQPRVWFDKDKNSISVISQCLDRNAEEMRNLLGRFAGFVFVAAVMTVVAIVWSFAVCWKLTIVGLASAPAMHAITRAFQWVSGRWEGRSNDQAEAAASVFTETFTSIRVVRALTLEGYFRAKYAETTKAALKVGMRRATYSGVFFGLADSGILFITAVVFYYGAILASTHQFSTPDILTVFTMLIFSIANASSIITFIPQINSSRDTATRLLRLSQLPLQSHELAGMTHLATPLPIRMTNLSFSYPSRPSHAVLRGLTLTIPPNSSTAIVGRSGSGKSTLASLILALYPPTSSPRSLTFASHPCHSVNTSSLRAHIGMVPQTPVLFPTTLAENIAYGAPEATPLSPGAIEQAARRAGIHEFISSLPLGYATPVGDGGASLSGGQAQRVAIARALARSPQLLVFDEATSSLDAESAETVRATIRGLLREGGVAVVLVTHEAETMRLAQRICVLEDGRVVQEGGWAELLGRRGAFRAMMRGGLWEG